MAATPTPEQKLDAMLAAFEKTHDTAAVHPGRNLRDLIDKTPALKADILASIGKGNLERFEDLTYPGAVGTYDAQGKALAVSVDQLKSADRNVQAANTLRFTLGHEIQHSVNRQDILSQQADFDRKLDAIARGPSPHDYTQLLRDDNARSRRIEATAEIAGFNTLAENVRRDNPKATLKDLYDASPNDMQMYIDVDMSKTPATYTPKQGLAIGSDLKIDASKKDNVEAIGKLFYDANGYPRDYIGRNIGAIAAVERQVQAEAAKKDPAHKAPQIDIDLKALGISGTLPPGFNDTSKPRMSPDAQAQRDPRSPDHPDHAYFQLLRDRLPAHVPDNAVAHAMYLAKQNGMTEPSKVDAGRVGFSNGSVLIAGTTPGYHVGTDPARSPPMAQVSDDLAAQRERQAASLVTQPQAQVETRTQAPHAL